MSGNITVTYYFKTHIPTARKITHHTRFHILVSDIYEAVSSFRTCMSFMNDCLSMSSTVSVIDLLDGFCFLLFVCGMTRKQMIAFLIFCMSNHNMSHTHRTTVVPTKSDRNVILCLQLLSKVSNCTLHLS